MREILFTVTLDDCEVQTFRAGGPGGQHQNKTASGVRVIHRPSGARGESREHRSQLQNKKAAFGRMASSNTFRVWAYEERRRREGHLSAEARVLESLTARGAVKVEVKDSDGRWVEADPVFAAVDDIVGGENADR